MAYRYICVVYLDIYVGTYIVGRPETSYTRRNTRGTCRTIERPQTLQTNHPTASIRGERAELTGALHGKQEKPEILTNTGTGL